MNSAFYDTITHALASERMEAYRQHDGAEPKVCLARYIWNMALCETLYSPLQMAEVALRNAMHQALAARYHTADWFSPAQDRLLGWQNEKIVEARKTLESMGKPTNPGRMIAELSFGFWTGFFNHKHARSGLGHYLVRGAFPHAPRDERSMERMDLHWKCIRTLRNRVFHHERIVHFTDLEAQHTRILDVIGWIRPELRQLAAALDRFATVRREGLNPWLAKLGHHWPHSA
jgi:hypothetical protein